VTRILAFIAAGAVTALGAGMVLLYGLLVTDRVGQLDNAADAALLAGIGAGFAIAGLLAVITLQRRHGGERFPVIRLPAIWVCVVAFAAAIALGAFAVRSARYPALDPLLALAAVAATFMFVARIATRWGPRKRVAMRAVFGPSAWGMTGAVAVALLLQLAFFGAIVGAVYVGLYAHEPGIAHAAWRDGIGDKIDHAGGSLAQTWTIGLAALLLYAFVAPLTEEFAKFLGVVLVMRRRTMTRHCVFVAGASAGLGFAVLETLLYGLASADKWPLVIGLRAPVVFIHVTGTTLTALGWHMQRSQGGFALVWHYAAAVLVHGAWNGLTVALLISSATSSGGEHVSVGTGLAILTVLSLMALLWMSCATWVVMNARRFGKADASAEEQSSARFATLSTIRYERGGALQSVAAGEV
jgi:RsiW-degrading membrane proteinase PrsW (M82 family)